MLAIIVYGATLDGDARYPGPEAMYEYDLFAVINHEGQMDNGHYTNYARFQDEVSLCCASFIPILTPKGSVVVSF